jgi:hypothetical protein
MCLIIQGSKSSIGKDILADAYDSNQDGWGIMYSYRQKLKVTRGFTLENLYRALEKVPDVEIFVHLRMRTHGDISQGNLHPYRVTNDLYLMHNGIADVHRPYSSWSDTKAVVALITPLVKSNPLVIFTPGFQKLFEPISKGSRFVFLHSSGRHLIFNRNQGIEYQDLWCSNTYAWSLWKSNSTASSRNQYLLADKRSYNGYFDYDDFLTWENSSSLLDRENNLQVDEYFDLDYLRSLDEDSLLQLIDSDPLFVVDAIRYS